MTSEVWLALLEHQMKIAVGVPAERHKMVWDGWTGWMDGWKWPYGDKIARCIKYIDLSWVEGWEL